MTLYLADHMIRLESRSNPNIGLRLWPTLVGSPVYNCRTFLRGYTCIDFSRPRHGFVLLRCFGCLLITLPTFASSARLSLLLPISVRPDPPPTPQTIFRLLPLLVELRDPFRDEVLLELMHILDPARLVRVVCQAVLPLASANITSQQTHFVIMVHAVCNVSL